MAEELVLTVPLAEQQPEEGGTPPMAVPPEEEGPQVFAPEDAEENTGPVAPAAAEPSPPPEAKTEYDAVLLEQPETIETEWGSAEGLPGQWKVTPRVEGGKPFFVHAADLGLYFTVRPAS